MLLDAIPLVGVLVPGDVAVLGAMAARGPAGGVGVLFGVVAGCLAGWSATFLVGRLLRRRGCAAAGSAPGSARPGGWRPSGRCAKAAAGSSMVAPFLPVLNALVPLAAGGLRMSYRRFLASAAVGGALWAGLLRRAGRGRRGARRPAAGADVRRRSASVAIGLTFGWVVLLGAPPPPRAVSPHP